MFVVSSFAVFPNEFILIQAVCKSNPNNIFNIVQCFGISPVPYVIVLRGIGEHSHVRYANMLSNPFKVYVKTYF